MAVNDQTQLNYYSGHIYAWKNARFPNITYELAGNYRNFDIAPHEYIPIVMDAQDNARGITLNSKKFVIQEMDWMYDAQKSVLLPAITVSEVTT